MTVRRGGPPIRRWRAGDPFLSEDGIEAARKTIREPVFRQLRLGQWVTGVESWLPWGAWDACSTDRVVQPRERVVLAFDGSASGDSTALVGCTLDGHLWVEGCGRTPAIRAGVFRVKTSPTLSMWRSQSTTWSSWRAIRGVGAPRSRSGRSGTARRRVMEWNTAHAQRMAPATDRLYQAVVTKAVTHDGDPRMAAHIAHCVAKRDPDG